MVSHSVSQSVSPVTQSCPTLYNPMNHSTPGLPVHHQLLFTFCHKGGVICISEVIDIVYFFFFWLHWFFVADRRLSLVMLIRGYSLAVVHRILTVGAVQERYLCLRSCGATQLPHGTWNLPRPGTELVSLAPAGGFLTLNHQGSPSSLFLKGQPYQFSSVAQSYPTLCDPTNHSTPGLPVHYQLPEFTQTHIHRVGYAIQPSHPLSSLFPPAPNPSQHQSLFQ